MNPELEKLYKQVYESHHYVYETCFGNGWAQHLGLIPKHMQAEIVRYICFGIPPGDFLTELLCNRLMETIRMADDINRKSLPHYDKFLHNFAPSDCFGSQELFDAWTAKGGAFLVNKESVDEKG